MFSRKEKRINNFEPAKVWFWCLLVVFTISLFSYGFLVQNSIVNVVNRQNMENEIAVLNSHIIELEAGYIKAKNAITPEIARDLGFKEAVNQKFVTRTVTYPSVSLLTSGN